MPSSKKLFQEIDALISDFRASGLEFDDWCAKKDHEKRIAHLKQGAVPFDDVLAQAQLIYPEFIHYQVQDGYYTEQVVMEPITGASCVTEGSVLTSVNMPRTERLPVPIPRIKRVTELIWKEWR